jgi:hypothetical protein
MKSNKMYRFERLDYPIQLSLFVISLILIPLYGIGFVLLYFVLGPWQFISYLINYVLKGKSMERVIIYYTYSLILVLLGFIVGIIFIDIILFYLYIMLLVGLALAIFYLIISYRKHKIILEADERITIFRLK